MAKSNPKHNLLLIPDQITESEQMTDTAQSDENSRTTHLVSGTKPVKRTVRLMPVKEFPIRHYNGGIVFYPGQPSSEVLLDDWLENQVKHGILKEV